MSSSHNDPLPYAVIGFFAGFYYFYKGFKTYREFRVVEDTPEMPIRSIAMGLSRVHGKVVPTELVPSPVSHTPCCFYQVVIEKWKTDNRGGGSWSNYRTDTDGVRFYLQDNTGKVQVDAHDAELDLLQTARVEIGRGGVQGIAGGATEAELRSYTTGVTAKKISNFVERRLNAQRPHLDEEQEKRRQAALQLFQHPLGSPAFLEQMLAAQGPRLQQHLKDIGPQSDPQKEQARLAMMEAYNHPPGSPEFQQNIQRAMALQQGMAAGAAAGAAGSSFSAPAASQPVAALTRAFSSMPATSGRFRFTEYCILPDHWYDLTGTCVENPHPQDEHDRNLILKGRNEPTFLISYRNPKEVESRLRRRAAGQIFGGAALSIGCLAYILYRAHMF